MLSVLGFALLLLAQPLGAEDQEFIVTTSWGERVVKGAEVRAYELYNKAKATPRSEQIDAYRKVLAVKRDLPEALINLSNLLLDRGLARDASEARELLEIAIKSADHPNSRAIAHSNLGHLIQRSAGSSSPC